MSLFTYNNIPLKEKILSHHPWERIIESKYAGKAKYVHNSVNNPHYPRKKEQKPDKDQVRITIIGNMVTKEFNYCVNLLNGMHKYRWKKFAAPVIKGLTSVEWPGVLNDLKTRYGGLAHCLQSQVAILMDDEFLGGEKELKELIGTKYVYHLTIDYYKESVKQFVKFVKSTGRPFTYFHICIDKEHAGTMIFMLYDDILPRTCENFLGLCKAQRGGYSGTPIHRIVKDGWIQCGGYSLKDTKLGCENFIVPHDRRGVLCMANDGRHVDCSTQFFVLLQPAPWMAQKYVAFGQLVDGDKTLEKIESVPTWYESPKQEIIIYESGVLDLDCHNITINKKTREYINDHIDDLVVIGELFYQELLERVFLEIEKKNLPKIEEEEEKVNSETTGNIRATARFMRNKEDIEKQLQKSDPADRAFVVSNDLEHKMAIEYYEYEPEELQYQHVSLGHSACEVKPERPFYIPLTDVPYPGETDSTFDLKKFLRGDYCLESDLEQTAPKKDRDQKRMSYASEMLYIEESSQEFESSESLNSEDEEEIQYYLSNNMDQVSFAGNVIKGIAKTSSKLNLMDDNRKSEIIPDEQIRKYRLASANKMDDPKKVCIVVDSDKEVVQTKIKRRETGLVRPDNVGGTPRIDRSDSDLSPVREGSATGRRKVRITPLAKTTPGKSVGHRPTGFFHPSGMWLDDSNIQIQRPSALVRLYDNVAVDEPEPTLKDYRSRTETRQKSFLTYSPNSRIKSEDSREKYLRHSLKFDDQSFEDVLNLQHGKKTEGKKLARKISSDYVKTIDQIQHKPENSIRTLEFAKSRPMLSISEYRMKNLKYKEEHEIQSKLQVQQLLSASNTFFESCQIYKQT